jgi:hypothetical protein
VLRLFADPLYALGRELTPTYIHVRLASEAVFGASAALKGTGLGAPRIQARSRNDICSMFEAALGAASGGHTWFRPLRFAA